MLSPSAPSASIWSTAVTIVSNVVGAGLLSLPYTISVSGLVPGVMALAITGLLNATSAALLARCCMLSGGESYKDLVAHSLGEGLVPTVSVILSLYTLGSCASYVVVLGDQVPSLLKSAGAQGLWCNPTFLLPLLGLCFLFPLSLLRNLSSLKATSSASFVCIVYVSLVVVSRAIQGPRVGSQYIEMARSGEHEYTAPAGTLAVGLVAFTMHYNIPRFWKELGVPSPEKKLGVFTLILAVCFGFVALCYESVALSGYLLFGSPINGNPTPVNPKGDILLNFAFTPDIQVARVALICTQILNFPIVFNSHRASVASLLPVAWQARVAGLEVEVVDGEGEDEGSVSLLGGRGSGASSFSLSRILRREGPHALLTAFLITLSVLFAVLVPNLSTILGVKGATGGVILVYVLPAVMHFALVWGRRRRGGGRVSGGGKDREGGGSASPASSVSSPSNTYPSLTFEDEARTPSPLTFFKDDETSPWDGGGGGSTGNNKSPGEGGSLEMGGAR